MIKARSVVIAVYFCCTIARAFNLQEREFLNNLSQRAFNYFIDHANSQTGLVHDRALADGTPRTTHVASIAATGFGLTALCIGAMNGWISYNEARSRTHRTLSFIASAPNVHGWYYHFVVAETGERVWKSELSSIDTAFLIAGALTASACFPNEREINSLAMIIYDSVDFQWMLNGHPYLLSHGWRPETGFLKSRWDSYAESMLLYLLAIGSRTFPVDPEAWYQWSRKEFTYAQFTYVRGAGPLFVHQFSHAWIDFRKKEERTGINWFENSIEATYAHRQFCADLAALFPTYSLNLWGITSSDSIQGYIAWGGPPFDPLIDGTVVPSAAAGSLMFTPEISIPALMQMRENFGERVFKKYGFVDAFNPMNDWTDSDVIGIDLGITLASAQNLLRSSVWKVFMRQEQVLQAMSLARIH